LIRFDPTPVQLSLSVFASGASEGTTTIYEDDGTTIDYLDDEACTWTTASWSSSDDGSALSMKVASAIGTHFNQMPASRDYTLHFVNVGPAAKVTLTTAGKTIELRAARHGHAHSKATKTSNSGATWSYDGPTTTLVVTLPAVVTAEGFTLDVGLACPSAGCGAADALLSGLRGAMSYTKKAKVSGRG